MNRHAVSIERLCTTTHGENTVPSVCLGPARLQPVRGPWRRLRPGQLLRRRLRQPLAGLQWSIDLGTTSLLLVALTLTAWWSSGGRAPRLKGQGAVGWVLGLALVAALGLGVSGAITALGDMLFPAPSLVEGIRRDFLPSAHFL